MEHKKITTLQPERIREWAGNELGGIRKRSAEWLEIDRTVLYHWQRLAGEQGTDSTATLPVRELRKQVRDLLLSSGA